MATSLLKRAPVAGKSNFGTGVQPARGTPQTPRRLGTMTSADLNRSPNGSPNGVKPSLTGAPVTSGYSEYHPQTPSLLTRTPPTAAPVPASPTNRGPSPAALKFLQDGVPPSAAPLAPVASAPVAAPTTSAAQQTETANPLSGDTNDSAGGTTQAVDPAMAMGFSRRGAGVPRGQDAMPGTGATRAVGDAIKGTYANLRGGASNANQLSRRQFSDRRAQSAYSGGVRNLFAGLAV